VVDVVVDTPPPAAHAALAALDETLKAHEIATALVNALGIPGGGKPKDVVARAAAHLGEPCPAGRPHAQLLALARKVSARGGLGVPGTPGRARPAPHPVSPATPAPPAAGLSASDSDALAAKASPPFTPLQPPLQPAR
jgi:hypothetical protein